MLINEIINNHSVKIPKIMNGEDLLVSKHLFDRISERRIKPQRVVDGIVYAIRHYKEDFGNLPIGATLVLRDPTKFGIALSKIENTAGSIYWIVKTAHKRLYNVGGDIELPIPNIVETPKITESISFDTFVDLFQDSIKHK